ncbi:LOW QUALITY PROTEIN: hypothetical protein Cgig2_030558 [Carnegiea gigantea]|uniref:non-specific serine/threonine protein kinase n=1 Tax=Carnegiea gigantea TaxID=171969 RepID=A0A9Q1JN72_9CARY|nr:LOW QUALITY PROTEIN: hypothetical protein Cgig2_030558 [Carnegiea gigantea]
MCTTIGLDFLHNGCRPDIIHRDVKSPNILLNQHLSAKIADFGFSKILPDEYVSVLSTRSLGHLVMLTLSKSYSHSPSIATVTSGQLNERSDVYSFGVVLLELITGKGAIVSREKTLVKWAHACERGFGEHSGSTAPRVENRSSLWRATHLAMECVKLNAAERPAMNQTVSELKNCLAMERDARSPIGRHTKSMEIVGLSFSTVMGPTAR